VSKLTLDVVLMDGTGRCLAQERISNSRSELKRSLKRWSSSHGARPGTTLACLEPTSYYSNLTLEVLAGLGYHTWLANPMDIKQSIGMTRGKSDKIDALRIAVYARKNQEKARLLTEESLKLGSLKQLLSRRAQLVERRVVHQRNLKEMNPLVDKDLRKTFDRLDKSQVQLLTQDIEELDALMETMIQKDPVLQKHYQLLRSIDGIGPVLATQLLAITHGFTRFTSARQLACHAGCAPFENSSGSSIRGRTRVSHKADHTLKRLLHVSVLGLIRFPGEFKEYFDRKKAEGKHALLILNALRNKLIHRVYAVLKRETPFIKKTVAHVIE
jgi:transposase